MWMKIQILTCFFLRKLFLVGREIDVYWTRALAFASSEKVTESLVKPLFRISMLVEDGPDITTQSFRTSGHAVS